MGLHYPGFPETLIYGRAQLIICGKNYIRIERQTGRKI